MSEIDVLEGFASPSAFHFPAIVNVNVLRGLCPCRCVHCPVGRTPRHLRKTRFDASQMELAMFRRIVDEMACQTSRPVLRIHAVGEPTRWRSIRPAIAGTHAAGVRTWLFTCATARDQTLLGELCEHINIIEVSVNSTNAVDYHRTKGIDAFDLVAANIGYMRKYIDRHALPTRLIASRVQSTNQTVDEEFVAYWQATGLVDDAFVRTYHTYNHLLEELDSGKQATVCHEPCLVHWSRFNVDVDGSVVVCFNELFADRTQACVLANLSTSSIQAVWKGTALNSIRLAELRRDLTQLPLGISVLPCKDCTTCQPLFGNSVTSEHQITALECAERGIHNSINTD